MLVRKDVAGGGYKVMSQDVLGETEKDNEPSKIQTG
jgi:hypothetical protein